MGTLGDPAAIAVLEPLTQVSKPYTDPLREAAAKSSKACKRNWIIPQNSSNVWQRLQDLQKKNRFFGI